MRSGVRCAETTVTSWGISNCFKISDAACMMPRSLSLPMMMPTRGLLIFDFWFLVCDLIITACFYHRNKSGSKNNDKPQTGGDNLFHQFTFQGEQFYLSHFRTEPGGDKPLIRISEADLRLS